MVKMKDDVAIAKFAVTTIDTQDVNRTIIESNNAFYFLVTTRSSILTYLLVHGVRLNSPHWQ